jgi:hypothetical protein
MTAEPTPLTADWAEDAEYARYADLLDPDHRNGNEPADRLPDLADVTTMTPPDTLDDVYIRGFMRPAKLVLIAASEGIGKSYVRKECEVRLATGAGSLFGHYPMDRPLRVGTVDEENGPDEEYRRDEEILAALGLPRTALGGRYRRASYLGLNLGAAETQAYLRRQVEDLDVLFLDTGGAMVDEEYGPPLKVAVRFLRSLIREHPMLTIVVCVHMVKPLRDAKAATVKRRPLSDVMGQWTRQADVVAVMTDLGADRFRWELVKRRGVPKSAGIIDYSGGLAAWVADADAAEEVASTDDTIRVLRAIAAGATGWKDVTTGLGMSKDRVFVTIRALRADGLIGGDSPYKITRNGWEALE